MFLRIESDKFELGYARFLRRIKLAIQETFEEQKNEGVSQSSIAAELGVDRSVVSKRLSGSGNVTLRTISDLFIAMGREPLENFSPHDENVNFNITVINNNNQFIDRFQPNMTGSYYMTSAPRNSFLISSSDSLLHSFAPVPSTSAEIVQPRVKTSEYEV
ncbi:helix-turn-helix domain-containing protein [Acetobacter sp.]|uniref:helix-turn-helix domain-containing protein n=1 Tax=Acetobacter sp. TaxID=440 RepID=UPI00258E48CC|nr:helix-turn-helix transcriptional regulator [Acetobacter sp.]MCC6104749.1 helix-turn-helix domain-containing protein [Acetobacter sp.]